MHRRSPPASWLWVCAFAWLLGACSFGGAPAQAPEFRAYWVDAWHGGYKSAGQCDQLITDMKTSNCNVAVVQVRRRGDTYFPSEIEPWAPDANPSFDSLRYMLDHCHAQSPQIQVYAWIVYIPIWHDRNALPTNPNHPYYKYPQYLSRDQSGEIWSSAGAMFDPGHPDCEQYLHSVCQELVDNYPDLDGINYDYIRYSDGGNWGYNPTSVSRFNARYGRGGTPGVSDPLWCQWRRDQITNIVRKDYLNAIAVNPNISMSAAVIGWHPTPQGAGSWEGTRPYYDIFQDWRSWMEEGILDLSMPMVYFDRDGSYANDYVQWSDWSKEHQYNRGTVIGPGIYMNDIADSIWQIRNTRVASNGYTAKGVVMFSYATTNDEGAANSTFYNALSHPSSYDPNPTPVFDTAVTVPTLEWKSSPTKGHIKGSMTQCGTWIDGAAVNLSGTQTRSMATDGTGFYGFVDLTPGPYTVSCTYGGQTKTASVTVTAGHVSNADLDFCGDTTPPVIINVQAAVVTANTATITWATDDAATSQVSYGLTSSYGQSTTEDTNYVTSHSVLVSGLNSIATYHYRVKSTNAGSLTSYSGDYTFTTTAPPTEIIIDDLDPEASSTGSWATSTYAGGWPQSASEYKYASTKVTADRTFTWRPNLAASGNYDIYIWYVAGSNRSAAAPFTVACAGGTTALTVDQTVNGGQWYKIATSKQFNVGTSGYVRLANNASLTGKVVIADAVEFVMLDATPPSAVTVTDEGAYTPSQNTLKASWTAATDTGSGIQRYDYAVGTSSATQNIRGWTSAGTSTSVTATSLTLTDGTKYYIQARAVDNAGNVGGGSAADGITVAPGVSPISYAWAKANTTDPLSLRNKVVTAALPGAFWLEETDRTMGIKVVSNASVARGNTVSVAGVLGMSGVQRALIGDVVINSGGSTTITPLGVIQNALGGGNFNASTPGVTPTVIHEMTIGAGLYNVGLLVKVWGNVTYSNSDNPSDKYFFLYDGSRLSRDGHAGVLVRCGSVTPPSSGTRVVTGIVATEQAGSIIVPVILIGDSSDIAIP